MKDTEKIDSEEGADTQVPDEYSQFLSEWKTSAIVIGIGLVLIGGIVFFLLEGRHMWQRLF